MNAGGAAAFAESLARARTFLEEQGSALDLLRLEALAGARDPEEPRSALEALQREDGSFAPLPGREGVGPVVATLEALQALVELRVRRAPSVERAVVFLTVQQAGDGSWAEPEDADDDARLALTGRIAGFLSGSVYARPSVLAAAGDFLGREFAAERVEGGGWPLIAALCAFFSQSDHERADEALQWCGRELERSYRTRAIPAHRAARVLTLCDAVGMPGARLDPRELVFGILAEQQDDGGWPAADEAPADRAATTLDAALALVRLPG